MPVYFDRYERDHSQGRGIGGFLRSSQLRDAVRQGAQDVAAIANETAGISKIRGLYDVESGPDVVVTKNGNPRLSERVVNNHPAAAADEFGSGTGSWRGGDHSRPQGGGSPPNRTLGKAGARIGDNIRGRD